MHHVHDLHEFDDRTTAPRTDPLGPAPGRAPSAGARTAWWLFGALMLLATLAWGTYNVVTLLAHEQYTEISRFDAANIRTLDVSSPNGSVTVVGNPDAEEIEVTAEISDGLRRTGNRQEVIGDRLELSGSCPVLGSIWCSVDYTVELPPDIAVVASTDNNSVTVSGIDAPLDVNADNGSVEVADVSGALTLENDNGRITATGIASDIATATNDNGRVQLTFVEPPTSVRATTNNGSVEVVLPDDNQPYRLDIRTDNGDVVDAISSDPAGDRSIAVESDNGDVTVRYGT